MPLNQIPTDALMDRKDHLTRTVFAILQQTGIAPDYPFDVMVAARQADLADDQRIALLEALMELESIKYTLCARRLRDVAPDEADDI